MRNNSLLFKDLLGLGAGVLASGGVSSSITNNVLEVNINAVSERFKSALLCLFVDCFQMTDALRIYGV
jgi:hypothetical protein